MAERIDGFLSGKAQAEWKTALVVVREDGAFDLRRKGEEPVTLGKTFKDARMALYALIRASRADRTA